MSYLSSVPCYLLTNAKAARSAVAADADFLFGKRMHNLVD